MRETCMHRRSGYVLRYDKLRRHGAKGLINANTAFFFVDAIPSTNFTRYLTHFYNIPLPKPKILFLIC